MGEKCDCIPLSVLRWRAIPLSRKRARRCDCAFLSRLRERWHHVSDDGEGVQGGLKINGGTVSLPASSPFERFCFVVVFARWLKALCRNAAICAEICGKSIFPYLFNTAITQGSLLQRRTFTWRGLLGLKCAGVIIAPGSCPRLPGTLATSTNIRRRCTWFWQI